MSPFDLPCFEFLTDLLSRADHWPHPLLPEVQEGVGDRDSFVGKMDDIEERKDTHTIDDVTKCMLNCCSLYGSKTNIREL